MDTEWFAIDGLGHVAVFDSGEAGGVPHAHFEAWQGQSMWSDLLEQMLRHASPGELRFVAEGVFVPTSPEFLDRPDALAGADAWERQVVFELDAPRDAGWLAARLDDAWLLGCAAPLVYAGACTPAHLASIWEELGIVRAQLSPELEPSRFGLYFYESHDYSGSPYQRSTKPRGAPLRVESLATGLRRRLGQVRLASADFRRDGQIQPFEHLPSSIWGHTWIGTDGSVHDVDD